MRLKNVKGALEYIENSDVVINNPEDYKGKYQRLFGNNNPIHLEIGTGKGNFIIEMAKALPNINFIGMEMYDSVLIRAAQKLENENIPNLKLIKFDATNIENVFSHEISKLYLNFSDPWPKNRHEHRRLTSERFLKRYDKIFKDTKIIEFKTDNRKLFEYSLISFVGYGYKIEDVSLNLHEDDVFNIKTEYEEKFSSKGYPIYFVKTKN
ncbi:MAG: tRNA (guanosine(46)-N7)-methyltransferase TrmB [Bacilli bacterium]|nr:tRNA (guanosine(46)-N7)-methyltransferase TrmB [Bacilli bacterium]